MDDKTQNPGKRPRVRVTIEELEQIIESKDSEIDILKKKFNILIEENEKLRKTIEDLKQMHENDSSEISSSEDEMVVEEDIPSEIEESDKGINIDGSQMKPHQKTEHYTPVKGIAEKASQHKVSPNNAPVSSQKIAGTGKKAVYIEPTRKGAKNTVPGSSQKKSEGKGMKSKSVPIITTYNINVKEISTELNKILGHEEYNLKILGRNVVNIGVCTLEDFDKLKCMLKEKKINFYTYTPKSRRPFTILVKGLSSTFEPDEVLECVQSFQVNINVLGLHKLGGDKWLFQLDRESDIRGFRSIRYILHCRVTMTKQKRRGLIQCHNCQRFGHVATNCNMPYRCVKCSGDHGPGKCVIPPKGENNTEIISKDPVTGQAVRKIGFPTKCANCGVEGHVASSKECPRRRELLQKISTKGRERRVNGTDLTKSVSRTVNGISYAAAAKGAAVINGGTTNGVSLAAAMSEFDSIDKDCRRLLGGGLLGCLSRMRNFAREYRTLGSDEERSRALLGMLMAMQHDG